MENNVMEKVFSIALLAFCILLCVECAKPANELEVGEEVEVPIREIEHNGHNYLLFEGYGVIHDPNCSCQRVSEE
jgi:hypothetical protein